MFLRSTSSWEIQEGDKDHFDNTDASFPQQMISNMSVIYPWVAPLLSCFSLCLWTTKTFVGEKLTSPPHTSICLLLGNVKDISSEEREEKKQMNMSEYVWEQTHKWARSEVPGEFGVSLFLLKPFYFLDQTQYILWVFFSCHSNIFILSWSLLSTIKVLSFLLGKWFEKKFIISNFFFKPFSFLDQTFDIWLFFFSKRTQQHQKPFFDL